MGPGLRIPVVVPLVWTPMVVVVLWTPKMVLLVQISVVVPLL